MTDVIEVKEDTEIVFDIPPIDTIDISTGGVEDNEFSKWRKKFNKEYCDSLKPI
jgi:hypothetical protein